MMSMCSVFDVQKLMKITATEMCSRFEIELGIGIGIEKVEKDDGTKGFYYLLDHDGDRTTLNPLERNVNGERVFPLFAENVFSLTEIARIFWKMLRRYVSLALDRKKGGA